jgi:hypothetical protein
MQDADFNSVSEAAALPDAAVEVLPAAFAAGAAAVPDEAAFVPDEAALTAAVVVLPLPTSDMAPPQPLNAAIIASDRTAAVSALNSGFFIIFSSHF